MYINIELDTVRGNDILTSTFTDDKAVILIIQDALDDANGGGHPDPKIVWADIAATLGVEI